MNYTRVVPYDVEVHIIGMIGVVVMFACLVYPYNV